MTDIRENNDINGYYDLHQWEEQTKTGKQILIWKFFMNGKEFPNWHLIKGLPEQVDENQRILTYLWQRVESDTEALIRMDIVQCTCWRHAHQSLFSLLGQYQAPQLPEAAARKILLGDVAYIGFGEMVQSAVFARGNMIVRINSVGKQNVSIVDFARHLDESFFSKPELPGKGVIPEITSFLPEKETAGINEAVGLDVEVIDPLAQPLWYKFMVERGELAIKDEKIVVTATDPGETGISLFVTNEAGFTAAKTLRVTIE